ncbi:hypothetical protein [Kribbella sindirgiensis]|uniref:Uncharacterized protein n=1 Tax=Kribbella sindirgiensis TaxID=1124744 RepID=A0A4R0IJG8_9ACTN|nr:hypothetical protein [Kribbella sindirgiensis]TCC32314.1 hypothetical protein E0H50_19125 [Kribbella sindirgiensis]
MTRVDHRKPPARAARRQQRPAARRSSPEARPRKAQRSHSAVGAAIVASLAIVAVFAFILTRGTPSDSPADGLRMGSGTDNGAAAAPAEPTGGTTGTASKADRKPPTSAAAPSPSVKAQATTPPAVNTGPTSPKFKQNQWIAVLDKYPADAGQMAKDTAAKITRAGIPAKAMLVNGQYPGITNSSLAPVTGTWLVYLGPGTSSEQLSDLCLDPRTQAAYQSACATYEPAG